MMSQLFNFSSINFPTNFSIIFLWISFITLYIQDADAKCQIVCNKWADSKFHRCEDAEVKCATNLPRGFHCQEFSHSRPVKCLSMIPEEEMVALREAAAAVSAPTPAPAPVAAASPLRPHRFRQPYAAEYRTDEAPNVQLLESIPF